MNKAEKEELESILNDYYSDDEHVDTVAIGGTLALTVARMIGYKFKNN